MKTGPRFTHNWSFNTKKQQELKEEGGEIKPKTKGIKLKNGIEGTG